MRALPLAVALTLAWPAVAGEVPRIDKASLAPILAHSWALGASCDAPEGLLDWAIDSDGGVYRRDGGYTPMDAARFADGVFTTHDTVGIGLTIVTYQLRGDGTLRLMSEVYYEEGDAAGTPTVLTKDGVSVVADGSAETPQESPVLQPCPPRTAMFPAEPVAVLNGKWAALPGGSCSKGTGAIAFDLDRPVPRIARGPMGDMAEGEAYVLAIAREGDAWAVTEGSSMEASVYRFTLGKDGTLTQQSEYEGSTSVRFQRCM